MNSIRVTYSGLISFAVMLISIITGLIFTLIVTRRLEQEEFGLWSLIGSLLVYVLIFEPISTYWTTRHVARNEQGALTGLLGSGFLSIVSFVAYIVIIIIISTSSDVDFNVLLFSSILIPFMYINKSLKSIIRGYKPQGVGYTTLIFEFTKIPAGFILVYFLDLGIIGAITTTALAQVSQIIYAVFYVKKFSKNLFKKWLKISWLPMFSNLPDRIFHLDSTIFIMFFGTVAPIAYIGVSRAIANLVSNTTSISSALYPKLLSTEKSEYIELMFSRSLLFTIPSLGFVIAFAKSGLWLLNPMYVDGIYIVYAWSFMQFTYVFEGILSSILQGTEKIDIGFKANFKQYIKSKLFAVPLVYVISYSSYLVMLVAVFILSTTLKISELETLFFWGVIGTISNITVVIVFWLMTKKVIKFNFPTKQIIKYLMASIIATTISFILIENFLIYYESVFVFLPNLLPYIILFIGIYFGIMFFWDKQTKEFFYLILNEIRK